MKNITIQSNENLSNLIGFISQTNPDLKISLDKNILKVSLKSEHIENLTTCISIFMILELHNTLVGKLNVYLNCNNDSILNSICNLERYNPYIEPLKILLREHIKNNKTINLDSFLTFNCRGLQQDFFKIGRDYISIYNSEIENIALLEHSTHKENKDRYDIVDSSIAHQKYLLELNDIFLKLSEKLSLTKVPIKYQNFESIHVKNINNRITIVDSNNASIQTLIQTVIPFEITDEHIYRNETLRTSIILLLCILVFKTSTIVFHKSIPEEVFSQILLYLNNSKDNNEIIEDVNLFKCNGCDFCY